MLPIRRSGAMALILAMAVVCACTLPGTEAASAQVGRGRAFYDEPDYDMGIPDLPQPNMPAFQSLQEARRGRRPAQMDLSDRQLPRLSTSPLANMRFRAPMPDMSRSLRFRDRSRGASRGPRGPASFLESNARAQVGRGMNSFYGKAESHIDNVQPMDIDDPFGGPSSFGGPSYSAVPTQVHTLPRNTPFEAPAFTEVVSQIKEIVTHPRSTGEAPTMHHIIGSVVPAPEVAPPMAPPPVPTSFRNGPPLPSLIQTRSSSRIGPGDTTARKLTDRPRAAITNVEPVLLEDPNNSYPPNPTARPHSPALKPRFLIETEEQVQARKREEEAARARAEAIERKRNPTSIPFVEHNSQSQGHSFIEELAGVHRVTAPMKRVAALPPPLVVGRTAQNPHHQFRHWD